MVGLSRVKTEAEIAVSNVFIFVDEIKQIYLRCGSSKTIQCTATSRLTICFEFGFFHFVAGATWEKLLPDYNIFACWLWFLVLLTTLCGLALVEQVRHRSKAN